MKKSALQQVNLKRMVSPSFMNLFQELLETIESLAGLRTVIYDRQMFTTRAGRYAVNAAFSGHRSEFCALIRSTEAGVG